MIWLYLIIFAFLNVSPAFSSDNDTIPTCRTSGNSPVDSTQKGGLYITSQRTIRILVVFVKFQDDQSQYTYNFWPPNDQVQPFMTDFIDPDTNTRSTNYANITNYFNQMSLGAYHVIGDVRYVKTPHDRSYYGTPWPNWSNVTKDVLQNAVDPLVNFANYDNWTYNSPYHHTNQPDGIVDMIIMIWRGLLLTDEWAGKASLGRGNDFTVENGTITIQTWFGDAGGSGFTAQVWGERTWSWNFHTPVHEYGHWLLGSEHPYSNSLIGERNVWGMLYHQGDGICANAYERERVAWINPIPITGDILSAPLSDYVTTGVSYKYHPPNGAANEYYYFENHQKLNNNYDDATYNPDDKGIFVIHQQGPYSSNNNIRCKPSNGQWDWNDSSSSSCWGKTLSAWEMTSVNRNGYSNRDKIPKSGGGDEWVFTLIDGEGVALCGGWLHGVGLNNAFKPDYNDVFSPYSNPRTYTWANQQTNFTMEIVNQNESVLNVNFYITDPLAGKPSKPQNLQLTWYNNHLKLTWDTNLEPDLEHYKIYKKKGIGNYIYYASTLNTQYVDNIETQFTGGGLQTVLFYKITAVDDDDYESVYSGEKNAVINAAPIIATNDDIQPPSEFMLSANYPNPFNPSTTIKYSIPYRSKVILKIYDILGSEIETLVNEEKPPGTYEITWNAVDLPSGIYFYQLTAGDFHKTRKMILLK